MIINSCRKDWINSTTRRPLLIFSMAGLYSVMANTRRVFSLPSICMISMASYVSNPAAGDGRLTPGKYEDLITERSIEHTVGTSGLT